MTRSHTKERNQTLHDKESSIDDKQEYAKNLLELARQCEPDFFDPKNADIEHLSKIWGDALK